MTEEVKNAFLELHGQLMGLELFTMGVLAGLLGLADRGSLPSAAIKNIVEAHLHSRTDRFNDFVRSLDPLTFSDEDKERILEDGHKLLRTLQATMNGLT